MVIISCGNDEISNKKNKENDTVNKVEINTTQDSVDRTIALLSDDLLALKLQADTLIPELKLKFNFIEDKINNSGWYLHKKNRSKYQTHIEIPVSANGYFFLKSSYYGNDWIFHDCITVKVGEESFNSSRLDAHSDFNMRDNKAGKVFETLNLTKPSLDMAIIKEISENLDKEILIRFNGKETSFDLTLTDQDKKIIQESYLLSRYLTVLNNEEVGTFFENGQSQLKDAFILPPNSLPGADIKLTN